MHGEGEFHEIGPAIKGLHVEQREAATVVPVLDDGNACTTPDVCSGGKCVGGQLKACDDGNACTSDSCDPASGCKNIYNTASCNDGNPCTVNDACSSGKCAGGAEKDCNDGNTCTTDSCDPGVGCKNVANATACNDNNPCTTDTCDPLIGCKFATNSASCSDGNACTVSDQCSAGKCVGTGATNCNDGNLCTADSCDPVKGCLHTADATVCDDSNACTIDACNGGSCQNTAVANGEPCGNGASCSSGKCLLPSCSYAGTAGVKIPDNNPVGVANMITMPDVGAITDLQIAVDVTNSKINAIVVSLIDPAGAEFVLHSKSGSGTLLKTSYPSPTKTVSGDLTSWTGKNPKGKWYLKVVDADYLNNTTDGQINSWKVLVQGQQCP